ncbi:hypothetical protein BDN70DRAFT_862117 [Pholiota conissans]|uniref:Glycosyltransferase 61 catalytic domain-containing protein n=1 Tax=Pholiota conissans TaxID=109636 RepID=A0A9P5YZC1_9AGAR|nr:hypothetical protein BDN70DRAFT_862117 [Pholiota conissans]
MWTKRQLVIISLVCLTATISLYTLSPRHLQHYAERYNTQEHWHDAVLAAVQAPIYSEDADLAPTTEITETTLPVGQDPPGFVIFDRLYTWNGTLYAVTSNPEAFPELPYIISQGIPVGHGIDTTPTPFDMQIISPESAKQFLGEHAVVISGMSFVLWDPKQFMTHYYHWWGEIILGAMRSYSRLALLPGVKTPLPEPRRFILANAVDNTWRDRAGVDGPLMRAAWPDAAIERSDFWTDLIKLNQTFVFERAMVISRASAHRSPFGKVWSKMIGSTMNVTVPDDFWKPLQQRVVENVVGYVPVMDQDGVINSEPTSDAPVLTYISRQHGGRRLTNESHDGLMDSLLQLEAEGICEVVVVHMEDLTFSRQLEVASRTTIMLAVHGNGLTHQLWMPSGPRSTVIEIFYPKTYIHDYSMLARNMGHKHYGIWNDTSLTFPRGQWFKGTEGGDIKNFNGNAILVHGPTVANIIRQRLTARIRDL